MHVVVDEFQDLTPAHVLLVRLLAGPEANVFGVGDDDQTIYGYAGASPAWLIDYADLFPGSGSHDLTVNYRCAAPVVDGARTLLGHNRHRIAKTIHSFAEREPEDGALDLVSGPDPTALTCDAVQALVDDGVPPSDIAVLTRVNATLLGPALSLDAASVASTKPVDLRFLERTGVSAVLAWLRLATAPAQRLPGAISVSPSVDPHGGCGPTWSTGSSRSRASGRSLRSGIDSTATRTRSEWRISSPTSGSFVPSPRVAQRQPS